MSVIAAITIPGKPETWIGSDTAGLFGDEPIEFGPKWVLSEDGQWAFGIVGSGRAITILRANTSQLFAGLEAHGQNTPYEFSERLRSLLGAHGYKPEHKEGFGVPMMGMHGILASPTSVHRILPDLTALTVPAGHFAADGSGADFAVGFVEGLCNAPGDAKLKAPDMIAGAIRCAINHDRGCGGTIWADRIRTPEVSIAEDLAKAQKVVGAAKVVGA